MKSEMMTVGEFVEQKAKEISPLLSAKSPDRWEKTLRNLHFQEVRNAVYNKQDIHVENFFEYRGMIPELKSYSLNGNLAVYDRIKAALEMPTKAEQHRALVSAMELQTSRKNYKVRPRPRYGDDF